MPRGSASMASKDDSLRVKANAAVDDARVAAHEVADDAKAAVDTLVDDVKIGAHKASSDAKIKAHQAASEAKKSVAEKFGSAASLRILFLEAHHPEVRPDRSGSITRYRHTSPVKCSGCVRMRHGADATVPLSRCIRAAPAWVSGWSTTGCSCGLDPATSRGHGILPAFHPSHHLLLATHVARAGLPLPYRGLEPAEDASVNQRCA